MKFFLPNNLRLSKNHTKQRRREGGNSKLCFIHNGTHCFYSMVHRTDFTAMFVEIRRNS